MATSKYDCMKVGIATPLNSEHFKESIDIAVKALERDFKLMNLYGTFDKSKIKVVLVYPYDFAEDERYDF